MRREAGGSASAGAGFEPARFSGLPSGFFLGEVIGVRATLPVGPLGRMLAFAWVVGSPLPRVRQPPDLPSEAVELRSGAAG